MLEYDIALPDNVSDILQSDFWAFNHVSVDMLRTLANPVKFAEMVSVFVRSGECHADIDLISYHIKAPAIVNIRSLQILHIKSASDDFDAGFIMINHKIREAIFMFVNTNAVYSSIMYNPVVSVPEALVPHFTDFYDDMERILTESDNPYYINSVIYTITSFFFRFAHRCYQPLLESANSSQGRIADRFLVLVQHNFRKERFLNFYADALDITTKHLSRTIKSQTGYTAVQWIERYVVLEAKVMLKSSNLTVQQISDELNFPTQSFFGKYFKKCTGMSPKEFRNS